MITLSLLENVVVKEGKTTARCPACAENGGDRNGEHLVIYSNGRFGCTVNPGPAGEEHRRRIFALVGDRKVRTLEIHLSGTLGTGGGRSGQHLAVIERNVLGRLGHSFQPLTHTGK